MKSSLLNKLSFIKDLRSFFNAHDFSDIISPPVVKNPGMEPHIHPFEVAPLYEGQLKIKDKLYLNTSPEFYLKRVLAEGIERAFSIGYSFRHEPNSPHHRSQFLMLEWYRVNENYQAIKSDLQNLINILPGKFKKQKIITKTVQEIFLEFIEIDILSFLNRDELKNLIQNKFPDLINTQQELSWDDLFFLLFLNKIEPNLKKYPLLILDQYPAPLCALSTLNEKDQRVCDRFEFYIHGIEIANCYNEISSKDEHIRRFQDQSLTKKNNYNYQLEMPHDFLNCLDKYPKKSAGIALGVERFYSALKGDFNKVDFFTL